MFVRVPISAIPSTDRREGCGAFLAMYSEHMIRRRTRVSVCDPAVTRRVVSKTCTDQGVQNNGDEKTFIYPPGYWEQPLQLNVLI